MFISRSKVVISFVLVLSVLFFNSTGFSQDVDPIELHASQHSDKAFKQVEYYSLNNLETLVITGEREAGSGISVYDIELDLTTQSYTTTQVTGDELQAVLDSIANEQDSITNTVKTIYAVGVIVTTLDPVNEPLTETRQKLYWSSDGTYSYFEGRSRSAWAAYPTAFGTHWFINEDKWTELRYLDGNRTVLSSNYASYYNYDFAFNNLRTDVSHAISIEGYRTGSYKIYTTTEKSGEAAFLLKFRVIEY